MHRGCGQTWLPQLESSNEHACKRYGLIIKYVTSCIPRRHRSYTHLARPLLSACVKGGWGRDYHSSSRSTPVKSLKEYLKELSKRPKLVVLDVDYTIWPFHVDTNVWPPFKADGKGGATDSYGRKIQLYEDVRTIFSELHEAGIKVAAASRTDDPPASRELLGVLGVDKFFDYMEIFPSQKYAHFKNIKKNSGIDYPDMLFFDDEYRNIRDISKLGVTCFYINDDQGIDMERLRKGLKQFNDRS